jgi:hypothetical protein
MAKNNRAPKVSEEAMANLNLAFLEMYFKPNAPNFLMELASSWKHAVRYLNASRKVGTANELKFDSLLETAPWFRKHASLPVQVAAVRVVTDHELVTIRRLFRVITSVGRRFAENFPDIDPTEVSRLYNLVVQQLLPALLPVCIVLLRDEAICKEVTAAILDFSKESRTKEFAAEMEEARVKSSGKPYRYNRARRGDCNS